MRCLRFHSNAVLSTTRLPAKLELNASRLVPAASRQNVHWYTLLQR